MEAVTLDWMRTSSEIQALVPLNSLVETCGLAWIAHCMLEST